MLPSNFDVAEHKRMAVLFTAFRYGIRASTTAIENSEKSYKHRYLTYISKGFIGLTMLIKRKRKCRQRAMRLRKIHL